MNVRVEDYEKEIAAAVRRYERYIVCLEKTPDEFLKTVQSLVRKAIHAFANRASGLRHGIALDRHITVIISEAEHDRPLCGIYFNLHSPYVRHGPEQKR